MQLENKVAIVTGAASGIGKGIAALFARQGAKVVIADLNKRGADAAAAELGGAKRAIGVAVDVTDEAATTNCVAQAVAAFAGVDILVSNAGIQTVAPIDQFDFGKWKQLLAIHLDGAFLPRARFCAKCTKTIAAAVSFMWARCIPRRHPCSRRPTSPPSTG